MDHAFLLFLHFMVLFSLCNSAVCDCTILSANSNAVNTSPLSMSRPLTSLVVVSLWIDSRFFSRCLSQLFLHYCIIRIFLHCNFPCSSPRWFSPLLLVIFLVSTSNNYAIFIRNCTALLVPGSLSQTYCLHLIVMSVSRLVVIDSYVCVSTDSRLLAFSSQTFVVPIWHCTVVIVSVSFS